MSWSANPAHRTLALQVNSLSPSMRQGPDARPDRERNSVPWRWIALVWLAWFAMVALLALQRAGYWSMAGRGVPRSIILIEVTVGLTWGAMLPGIVLVSLRQPLGRGRWRAWAIHLAMFAAMMVVEAVVYVVVDGTLVHAIAVWSREGTGFFDRVRSTMAGHFMSSVQFFGVIVGVTQAHVYRRLYEDRRLRAARLEGELAQSQLHVLRSELHPHFLFNALHAVSTLMHRDVAAAETMLAKLSDLLRTSLASGERHEVALREELEFLERYVDIERTRFGDRLEVTIDAAPDTLDACVPGLLLQPLVENAIRHGISPRRGAGAVEVRARRRGDFLSLVVVDDGLGAAAASRGDSGIGLVNTRRRLEHLYGRACRFRAAPSPGGGFRVSLQLPFHTDPLEVDGSHPT